MAIGATVVLFILGFMAMTPGWTRTVAGIVFIAAPTALTMHVYYDTKIREIESGYRIAIRDLEEQLKAKDELK